MTTEKLELYISSKDKGIFFSPKRPHWLPVTQPASYPTGNQGTSAVGKVPVVWNWLFVST